MKLFGSLRVFFLFCYSWDSQAWSLNISIEQRLRCTSWYPLAPTGCPPGRGCHPRAKYKYRASWPRPSGSHWSFPPTFRVCIWRSLCLKAPNRQMAAWMSTRPEASLTSSSARLTIWLCRDSLQGLRGDGPFACASAVTAQQDTPLQHPSEQVPVLPPDFRSEHWPLFRLKCSYWGPQAQGRATLGFR